MRVFTCYARADREQVRWVHRALVAAGHNGWFDAFILPGEDWQLRLREEIEVSDVFLYTVSSASRVSEWCTWELAQAVAMGKPVIPARLERGIGLPEEIAHLHFADLTDDDGEDQLRRLLGSLARLRRPTSTPEVRDMPLGVPTQVAWKNATADQDTHQGRTGDPGMRAWDPPEANWRRGDGPCIGIDFGTVSSLVAVVQGGEPIVVPNRAGQLATLSAVAIDGDGFVVVGDAARNLAMMYPERAELYPKRLLGTNRRLHVDGLVYSGADLASYVLRQLRDDAAEYLGTPVGGAVLTAPTAFGSAALADLREAARLAGVAVVRVMVESTAACFAWGLGLGSEERTVVVYDLGGGTFDASVVVVGDGFFDVKSVAGDALLGGRNYDQAVVDYCVAEFLATTGIDLSGYPVALMRLRSACEATKVALSTAERATVAVPFIHGDSRGAYDLDVPLTRDKFEDLTFHLTDATIEVCRAVLADADLVADRPDELLLVGLATRTPMVRESVERCFGRRARRDIEPDAVVACGAAVQAGVLSGLITTELLSDVRSHALLVELGTGDALTLVPANQTIPTRRREELTTSNEDATIAVRVVEHAARRIPVAELILDGVPTGAPRRPLIRIEADIDANGTVVIEARVSRNGHRSVSCRVGNPTGQ